MNEQTSRGISRAIEVGENMIIQNMAVRTHLALMLTFVMKWQYPRERD